MKPDGSAGKGGTFQATAALASNPSALAQCRRFTALVMTASKRARSICPNRKLACPTQTAICGSERGLHGRCPHPSFAAAYLVLDGTGPHDDGAGIPDPVAGYTQLYYCRDKDGKEIDLLLVQDRAMYPIEIKKSASPRPDWIRHFGVLDRLHPAWTQGGVICLCRELLPLNQKVTAIPVGLL